jgi:hypothetical protein
MERIAQDNDLFYKDPDGKEYNIPAGVRCSTRIIANSLLIGKLQKTPVGMTTPLLTRNPELYPSPFEFRPERYIENPHLKRYSTVFSKGTYNCIGVSPPSHLFS